MGKNQFPSQKLSQQLKKPFHIVLVEPQIPPNTGNISRLCVGTESHLHIVGKPGFSLDEKMVKRAGLDHWPKLNLSQHDNFEELKSLYKEARFLYFSKFSKISYFEAKFQPGDFLVFGSEIDGLPKKLILDNPDQCFFIPITPHVRSLNLSNCCSIVLYEAIRQTV